MFTVSVLEGLIDSPKSLHQSSTIDSAKFNLSDSVCGKIPDATMAMLRWLQGVVFKVIQSSHEWVDCKVPDKWGVPEVCLYEPFFWQFVSPTLEVISPIVNKNSAWNFSFPFSPIMNKNCAWNLLLFHLLCCNPIYINRVKGEILIRGKSRYSQYVLVWFFQKTKKKIYL